MPFMNEVDFCFVANSLVFDTHKKFVLYGML